MLRVLDKKDRMGQGRARPGGQEIQESAFISGSVSSLWSLSQCPGSEGGGGGVVYRDTGWLQQLGGRLYNLLIDRILQKNPGLNVSPSNNSFFFFGYHPSSHHILSSCLPFWQLVTCSSGAIRVIEHSCQRERQLSEKMSGGLVCNLCLTGDS